MTTDHTPDETPTGTAAAHRHQWVDTLQGPVCCDVDCGRGLTADDANRQEAIAAQARAVVQKGEPMSPDWFAEWSQRVERCQELERENAALHAEIEKYRKLIVAYMSRVESLRLAIKKLGQQLVDYRMAAQSEATLGDEARRERDAANDVMSQMVSGMQRLQADLNECSAEVTLLYEAARNVHRAFVSDNVGTDEYNVIFQAMVDVLDHLPEAARAAGARLKQILEPVVDTYACDRCGRRDGLDTSIAHEDWAKVSEKDRWKLLCLWCMDELAAAQGMTMTAELYFAGKAIHSKLYGAEPGMGERKRRELEQAALAFYADEANYARKWAVNGIEADGGAKARAALSDDEEK